MKTLERKEYSNNRRTVILVGRINANENQLRDYLLENSKTIGKVK